jgi:hypothetical protein
MHHVSTFFTFFLIGLLIHSGPLTGGAIPAKADSGTGGSTRSNARSSGQVS